VTDQERPLSGLRVLELAEGIPAAFCSKLLSDLGADVLMVEPPDGHGLRAAEPSREDGLSARFMYLSTGKRSVVIDGSDGDRRLRELIGEADLFVTDAAPALAQSLVEAAPQTVLVGIRPFGATGPHADRRAHHLTLVHGSGEGSTNPGGLGLELFPERPPVQLGSEIGYFDAGWNAAVVGLAAYFDLLRSGRAERIDVSIQESLLSVNRTRMNRFLNEAVIVGREKSRYGITGMMRCQDGWTDVIGMREDQWDRLVALPEGAAFRDAGFTTAEARGQDNDGLGKTLAEWCAARPKEVVARILAAVGAPAGIYANPADLLASEQLAHREYFHQVDDGCGGSVTLPGAPYRLSRTPIVVRPAPTLASASGFDPRPPERPMEKGAGGGRMLEGIRVLDFTWAAAGPYATLLLALLGADVVRVESGKRLDPARSGFIARYEGTEISPIYNELNLNKRSVEVDLTQPEGAAMVRRLVADFDVVVNNFRPGVMGRFGLGPDDLLERHPHLVVASSSANGSTGPEAMAAGLASIFAAAGGFSEQTGYPDGPPTQLTDPMDYRAGAAFAVGILAALVDRARTGRGQHVDFSSREVFAAGAPDALLAHVIGVPWQPRLGNGHRNMAPHDVYPCLDGGWLALAVGDDLEREALARTVGRAAEGDGYDSAVREWAKTRTAADAAAALQAAGVPATPVMSFADVAVDPHLAARNVFIDVEHPVLGTQRVMRAPWLLSGWQGAPPRHGPLLAADNDEILGGIGETGAEGEQGTTGATEVSR
jgi:crotonobetainyl-CoA:carnitine CoA-transferase CaiB-like acyl-CoA transferase